MMQCFTVLDMHSGWSLSSMHQALYVIGISGFIAGLLNTWRLKDMAFTGLAMLLAGWALYLYLGQIAWETNPPYCWGDVFGLKEMRVTRSPTLGEQLTTYMGWASALFVSSFLFSTGLKFILWRLARLAMKR